jgi:hypothetical protein
MSELTFEEYQSRAVPRMAAIEALDARCEWDKPGYECSLAVLELRDRRGRLMREQIADEAAAGL